MLYLYKFGFPGLGGTGSSFSGFWGFWGDSGQGQPFKVGENVQSIKLNGEGSSKDLEQAADFSSTETPPPLEQFPMPSAPEFRARPTLSETEINQV